MASPGFFERLLHLQQGPVVSRDDLDTYTGRLKTLHSLRQGGLGKEHAKSVIEGARTARDARVPRVIQDVLLPPRPDEGGAAAYAFKAAVAFSQLPDSLRFKLMKQGKAPPAPPGWKMYEDGTFGPPPVPRPAGTFFGGRDVHSKYTIHS
jgi:hypothetical protein